jgi:hypothetical protein
MLGWSVEIPLGRRVASFEKKAKAAPKNAPLAPLITKVNTSHALPPLHAGEGWVLQHYI